MIAFLYKTGKNKFGSGKGLKYPIAKAGFVWLHLTNPSSQEITKVKNDFSIADTIFKKFYKEKNSVRYTFKPLAFTLVDYYTEGKNIKVEDVLFIIGEHFLITITKTRLSHYDEIFKIISERLKEFGSNIGYILHEILDYDAEGNFDVLSLTESRISDLEKAILDADDIHKKVLSVITYKRYLLQMWRRLWSNSKIIFSIKKGATPIRVDIELLRLFDHIHDTFIYQMDIVTNQREVLTDAISIYESTLTNRLTVISNKINSGLKKLTFIMFLWTAIATILSIPNTVATIFGIPEWPLTVDAWEFIAFILIVSTLVPLVWFWMYWKKIREKQV
ncbi:hypothetical protein J4209_03985 [Candidatus Woesearchaeota archaeon]|nr:hypothetical protein [Candidatus Woesearchaeota archaeon]